MRYAYVENGKIKQGPMNLPKSWKNISGFNFLTDKELKEQGWLPWEIVEIKTSKDEVLIMSTIEIHDDKIIETQNKRTKTNEEIKNEYDEKCNSAKQLRDRFLAESDWIVIKNIEGGITNIQEWKTYRQELRDITKNPDFPEVEWPIMPSSVN
jgi:hypothetical protein